MANVKRPQNLNQNRKSVKAFIGTPGSAKPSAAAAPASKSRVMKGHQAQITLALPIDLLERANAMADKLSISRAAFMKQADLLERANAMADKLSISRAAFMKQAITRAVEAEEL